MMPPILGIVRRTAAVAAVLAMCCAWAGAANRKAGPTSGEVKAKRAGRQEPTVIPTRFAEDRFFVEPVTADGARLTLIADTGGGLFITASAVKRLGLTVGEAVGDNEEPMKVVALPPFRAGASIPPLTAFEGRLPVLDDATVRGPEAVDGVLGQAWFKERVWTFDYPGKRLLLRAPDDQPAQGDQHRVALGFPTDDSGVRMTNYPRIQVQVDGQIIDLLFDTGATVSLSESALATLGDGRPAVRATSFITKSVFEAWRRKHPGWRVIEAADQMAGGAPLIEVPQLQVAGYDVGPVWFTVRQDANFHQWMSQWMDKQIEGALGGSALRFFRVTVDYPRAIAIFERAADGHDGRKGPGRSSP